MQYWLTVCTVPMHMYTFSLSGLQGSRTGSPCIDAMSVFARHLILSNLLVKTVNLAAQHIQRITRDSVEVTLSILLSLLRFDAHSRHWDFYQSTTYSSIFTIATFCTLQRGQIDDKNQMKNAAQEYSLLPGDLSVWVCAYAEWMKLVNNLRAERASLERA